MYLIRRTISPGQWDLPSGLVYFAGLWARADQQAPRGPRPLTWILLVEWNSAARHPLSFALIVPFLSSSAVPLLQHIPLSSFPLDWWSLVVTLTNSCSVHYQLAIPTEKELTNFRLHGQFSPFMDRQAWLQFCRPSWNASCPGQGEKGNSLWQLESRAWTGTYRVSTFCGTFSVQVKWWLLGVFNLMTRWWKEKGMSQHFYKTEFHQWILIFLKKVWWIFLVQSAILEQTLPTLMKPHLRNV